jgi:archaemetzincin
VKRAKIHLTDCVKVFDPYVKIYKEILKDRLCIINLLFFLCLLFSFCQDSGFASSLENSGLEKMESKIYLVPVGDIEKSILESLAKELEKTFGCVAEIHKRKSLPQETYNERRRQYSSSQILQKIHSFIEAKKQDKVLAVARVDLYVERLNFVFGEAELGGHFGIISLARLRQSFYGLSENKALFMGRAVKEAVHELGHVYGLEHCSDSRCVMHFSNSLMDTDRKRASFCARCRQTLEKINLRH